jgi:ubiquinone biosynthesis protein
MLPELPRLVHQALKQPREPDPVAMALLREQRRTNRMLQAGFYALVGFVLGVLAMQLWWRWQLGV